MMMMLCACAADGPGQAAAPPLGDVWSTQAVLEGTRYVEWTSQERGAGTSFPEFPHGNKDFNNFIAVCGERPELPWQQADGADPCEPPLEGYLIAARDEGPGVVSRMYFTAGPVAPPSRATFGEERLRIALDFEYGAFEPLASHHYGAVAFYYAR